MPNSNKTKPVPAPLPWSGLMAAARPLPAGKHSGIDRRGDAQRLGRGGHQPGRFLRRSARPADERGDQCPLHAISGRGFHLSGLPRLDRISRRHAECACPAIDAAVVVCEPEPAKVQMLQPYLKALSDAKIPHYLFVNKIRQGRRGSLRELAGAAAGGKRNARCCCARFPSGKMASPPALSIWRWSGPLPIAPMRRRRWSISPICAAKRKRASRCWSGWPIMTSI